MKKRLNLGITTVVLAVISLVLTIAAADTIRIGSGFGRETKYVINTQNNEQLTHYLSSLERRGIESTLDIVTDYEFIVSFSALDNSESIQDEIKKVIPDVTFKESGSFGSLTNYSNNQGFIRSYLVLLIFSVVVYYIFRYRTWGAIIALQSALSYALAFFMVNQFGFAFTETLWYTVVLTLLLSMLSKHSFVKDNRGNTINEVQLKGFDFIKRPLFVGLVNLVFGLVILISNLLDGQASGLFIAVFTVMMIVFDLVIMFLLNTIVDVFAEHALELLQFKDRWSFNIHENALIVFKRFSVLVAIIGLAIVMILQREPFKQTHGLDYDRQNIIIVSNSDATVYLEVEALLNSIGLFNNQVSYSTSDQGELWIYFNRAVSDSDLKIARNVIHDHLGINTRSYVTRGENVPIYHPEFYLSMIILLIISTVSIKLIHPRYSVYRITILSGLSILFLVFLLTNNISEWKQEFAILFFSFPTLYLNHYSTVDTPLTFDDPELFVTDFMIEFMTLVFSMLLLSGGILIVAPVQIGLTLVKNLIFYGLVIEFARIGYAYVYKYSRKYVNNNDDDTSTVL